MIGLIAWPQDLSTNFLKICKKILFDEGKDEIDDFEFNQDLDSDSEYRSPGWIRYQKRIK